MSQTVRTPELNDDPSIVGECAAAKFVMKVDDDAFVNPAVLWDALEHALLHTTSTRQDRG